MRPFPYWLALCMVSVTGCSPQQPAAVVPKASPAQSVPGAILELKQLMEWVVDPAADVIWDSVKTVSSQSGTKEIAPQTDEQWNAVRNAAATLVETSNLLMVPGRARPEERWANFAKGLTKTAAAAMKAAEAKNKDALFQAGGEIYTVCKACHENYARHLVSDAAPSAFLVGYSGAHDKRVFQ